MIVPRVTISIFLICNAPVYEHDKYLIWTRCWLPDSSFALLRES